MFLRRGASFSIFSTLTARYWNNENWLRMSSNEPFFFSKEKYICPFHNFQNTYLSRYFNFFKIGNYDRCTESLFLIPRFCFYQIWGSSAEEGLPPDRVRGVQIWRRTPTCGPGTRGARPGVQVGHLPEKPSFSVSYWQLNLRLIWSYDVFGPWNLELLNR